MRFVYLLLLAHLALVSGCAATAQWQGGIQNISSPTAVDIDFVQPQRGIVQIARIKNPVAKPLTFSPDQREAVRGALLPGDVLLTYTAGVSSNIVVPGRFKHASVYVGSEGDPNGDMIEALSQGVVLSRLDDMLSTRVNRLVALRPLLVEPERQAYVSEVQSYRGQKYDFAVDFRDPSRKVCTEVIYCALQGRGGLQFPLITRAGRATLTSDDIVQMHLRRSTPLSGFECVLLVDRDPQQPRHARLLFGAAAEQQLAAIMKLPLDAPAVSATSDQPGA